MNNKGFTLIELILVVAIMAVLAAVAVPSYTGLVDKSKESACLSQMQQIEKSFAIYLVDNPDGTLSDALEGNLPGISEELANYKCPSGGTYSVGDDGKIQCSEHGSLQSNNSGS